MAAEQKRLGRGLSSVLSAAYQQPSDRLSELTHVAPTGSTSPVAVPLASISTNPYQPRREMDPQALDTLVASLKQNGVIQSIVVRKHGTGYQLVAGHRRLEAAKKAGLTEIPVVLRDASDQEMLELALIENIHREDLNCIDRALAYRQYRDRFGLTPEQIGQRVGDDRTTVTNYLRLLALPETVQNYLISGQLSMGQARALLSLPDPLDQIRLATDAVDQQLSVRAIEQLVRTKPKDPDDNAAPAVKRPLIESLETAFGASLGVKVRIKEGKRKNTGRIVIQYKNLEDFDRIMEQIGVSVDEEN